MHIFLKTLIASLIYSFFSVLTVFGLEPETQPSFTNSHAHNAADSHVHLGWESSYFLEGRDSLDGDSLFSSSLEMNWEHFAGGVWYGYSPNQRYEELQLSLALTQCIGNFEFYGGYTHLRFLSDDSHDNEIGLGVAWSGLPMDLDLFADLYYSIDADGYFVEISAGREFEITDRVTLNFALPFGMNQGYVVDGHDGANNIALRLGVKLVLSNSVSVTVHTTYSWALHRDAASPGDDQLNDFFHGGVGLQYSF